MKQVRIEVSQCAGAVGRIDVRFDYNPEAVAAIKRVAGRSFVKTPDNHWHVPLDLEACRQLREAYGKALVIGPNLRSWAVNAVRQETALGTLSSADTAPLERLASVLPTLAVAIHLGPKGLIMTEEEKVAALDGEPSFQAADVRFLVESPNPLNGNQQGLGKTPEWIAAVWEQGIEEGNHLVIAPSAAVDGTWEPELEMWQADASKEVGIFAPTGTRAQREAVIEEFLASTAPVKWLVVNPQMIQWRKDDTRTAPITVKVTGKKALKACYCAAAKDAHEHYESPYPALADIVWDTIAIDECHKGNIRNHKTLTSQSIHALRNNVKRVALSGTPSKKKGADIWGILHWLRPDVFTSYWRFAEGYFDIEDNGYGKKVGALLDNREDAFYRMLMPYVLRRTKAECLPWLPPKHYIEVLCGMTEAQRKQYEQMESNGAAALDGNDRVTTTSILAEFTRLRQFSFGRWVAGKDGKLTPTTDSGKLEAMLEKMDEADVFEDTSVKQIVFSQFREVIELVAGVLRERGVEVAIISGKQNKQGQRRQIREAFQGGTLQVLCVVTTAGGVSLTLDAADTVHMLDETWSPDETEQAEDRAHRASRVHNVTVFQYRTKDSIDQYVQETAFEKASEQKRIMDVRRTIVAKWLGKDAA